MIEKKVALTGTALAQCCHQPLRSARCDSRSGVQAKPVDILLC